MKPGGRQTVILDALANRTTSEYDSAGRRTAMLDPLGNRTTLMYDAAARLETVKDARGNMATSVYDAGGRLQATVDANANRTTFPYDPVGDRTFVIDGRGNRTTFVYDAARRQRAEVDGLGRRTTFTYYAAGHAQTRTDMRGYVTTYTHDGVGRLTQRTYPTGNPVTFSYDAVGRRTVMVDPSGRTTYTYDGARRLMVQVAAGSKAIMYAYDAVANRATMVDPDGLTTTYTYDAANELTLEGTGGTLTTYSYDENGNTLAWNAAGSRTTLTWGYEDEVLTVQPSSGDPVTMTYDGDHMRRQREEGAATAKYLWDGAQILLDLDGSDATVARYTLAPFGYGDLLSQSRSSATSFYHFDALGSTRALTESDEDVSDTYLYDAWGVLKASTGTTTNPYRYVGRLGYLREAALDGYLLRRRYYREGEGRYVSRDPVRGRGRSRYPYVRGRPMRLVDPSGQQSSPTHCEAVEARLGDLSRGPFPANCQALNDLLFEYAHDCLQVFLDPLPKALRCGRPHAARGPLIPGLRNVPGYVGWSMNCHSIYVPPPNPPGVIVWPPERPVLPPPYGGTPPPIEPPVGLPPWIGLPPGALPQPLVEAIMDPQVGAYENCFLDCLWKSALRLCWRASTPQQFLACMGALAPYCEWACEPLMRGEPPNV